MNSYIGRGMETVLLLSFYQFQLSASCQQQYYENKDDSFGTLFGMGKYDHKLYRDPNHWTPSYDTRVAWLKWYNNWVEQQAELKKIDAHADEVGWTDYDHINKPRRWTHFPPGRDAQEPPPWAVIPHSYGKPDFCFQPPNVGTCNSTIMRWGFNPFKGACEQFNYTGCGGNDNNFLNRMRCEEACSKLASSLCSQYGTRRDGTPLLGHPC